MDTISIFLEHPLLQYPAMVWGCVFLVKHTLVLLDLNIRECLHLVTTKITQLRQWAELKLNLPRSHSTPGNQKTCHYLMAAMDYLFAWYFAIYAIVIWTNTLISHQNLPLLNQMGILSIVVTLIVAARGFRIAAINEENKAKDLAL